VASRGLAAQVVTTPEHVANPLLAHQGGKPADGGAVAEIMQGYAVPYKEQKPVLLTASEVGVPVTAETCRFTSYTKIQVSAASLIICFEKVTYEKVSQVQEIPDHLPSFRRSTRAVT
jgi:hypothetical protein